MIRYLFAWLDRLPNSIRAGIVTSGFAFLVLFGLSVIDVLADIQEWASADDVPFPDLSVLGKALVAAVVSSLAGIANAVVRYAQERMNKGNPPVYPTRTS